MPRRLFQANLMGFALLSFIILSVYNILYTVYNILSQNAAEVSFAQCLPDRACRRSNRRAAAAARSLQSCPTLCDPIDCSPPGSPVPGILQARTLEWVAIAFSNAWKWKVKVKPLSHVRLLATPWTAAYQAPRSMGFSRQESWSGLPLPSPNRRATASKNHDLLKTFNFKLKNSWYTMLC